MADVWKSTFHFFIRTVSDQGVEEIIKCKATINSIRRNTKTVFAVPKYILLYFIILHRNLETFQVIYSVHWSPCEGFLIRVRLIFFETHLYFYPIFYSGIFCNSRSINVYIIFC